LDLLGTEEKIPRYLVDWISNFIHTRQIALAYPGSPSVTGLFLSNENTIGPAIDLLALVLREASRDR